MGKKKQRGDDKSLKRGTGFRDAGREPSRDRDRSSREPGADRRFSSSDRRGSGGGERFGRRDDRSSGGSASAAAGRSTEARALDPIVRPLLGPLKEAIDSASPDVISLTTWAGRAGLLPWLETPESILLLGRAIDNLVDTGAVIQPEPFRYAARVIDTVVGRVEWNRDGYYAFVRPTAPALSADPDADVDLTQPAPPQIEIILGPSEYGALPGDTVRVAITHRHHEKIYGQILDRISPGRRLYTGTAEDTDRGLMFIPQDSRIKGTHYLEGSTVVGVSDGQRIACEVGGWKRGRPVWRVAEKLGQVGDHESEIHAIILEYNITVGFPEDAEEESNALPSVIPAAEIARRRDIRHITTFTIDPADAKDFDDALSFQQLPNGNYEVGVHIADVSYYVRPGTALEREALERATSVYLVDRTLPMLPERISNDLCSLRPNEDRLTYSAIFEMNAKGEIEAEWFGRCVIHSDRRFSYEEAQFVLDSQTGDYAAELATLNTLAHALRKKRFAEGSLNFETDEVKFQLDARGKPVSVYTKVRGDSNKLIEDFMLLANRRVAQFVALKKKKPPIPMVYRVHAVPEEKKLENLQNFVKAFGYDVASEGERAIAKSIAKLTRAVDGKPEQNLIQSVAIRSMAKAVYTTENIGHFGLGFKYYSHFTSPIRRYPDVMTHRVLDSVLNQTPLADKESLELACRHSSERERRAADAERASIKYKQVEYMSERVGQEFEGLISGVTEWGIYVEVLESKCEGLVAVKEIGDDYYELDEKNFQLVGRRKGNVLRLGDRIRIRVKRTNLQKRQIDFAFVEKIS